jgi:hypothetical protein
MDEGKRMTEQQFIIRKGGYYYRPNAQGYTSSLLEAGRYPETEAMAHMEHCDPGEITIFPAPAVPSSLTVSQDVAATAERIVLEHVAASLDMDGKPPGARLDDLAVAIALALEIERNTPSTPAQMVAGIPCHCTTIQQDETCPVGYPSLLCVQCDGKGVVHDIKLDGAELWEIVFGIADDVASEITEEQYEKIATAIREVFIEPKAPAPQMVGLSSADFETLAADLDIDWVAGLFGSRHGSGAEFLAEVARCIVPRAPTDLLVGDGEASIIECLAAGEPFVFDPAANFLHADDGTVEGGIRYLPADQVMAYPREATDDLRDVLSMMMWNTGPIAHVLRAGGADIPRKGELEQAHVLHWLTLLVLEHGSAWREKGEEEIKRIRAALSAEVEG